MGRRHKPKLQEHEFKPRAGKLASATTPAVNKTVFAFGGVTLVAVAGLAFGLLNSIRVGPSEAKASAQLYKNPQCSCCEGYASYLRNHGYTVTTEATHNLSLIRRQRGVPEKLAGCHTTIVGGYVVEGHVPVATIDKLLRERPKIKGISLPGMPDGSPGMTGRKSEPFTIYEISEGEAKVYAVE
jgi:hypothetical protein